MAETEIYKPKEYTWGGEPCRFTREHMRHLFKNDIKAYNRELRRMNPNIPDIEFVPEKRYDNKSTVLNGLGLIVLSSTAAIFGEKFLPIENSSLEYLAYKILPIFGVGGGLAYFGRALVDFVHTKEVEQLCKDLPGMYPPATLFPMLPGETIEEYKERRKSDLER